MSETKVKTHAPQQPSQNVDEISCWADIDARRVAGQLFRNNISCKRLHLLRRWALS